MASPHVAGLLAVYLADGDYNHKELAALLDKWSIKDTIKGLPTDGGDGDGWPFPWPPRDSHTTAVSTPNKLAYHPEKSVKKGTESYPYRSSHFDSAMDKMKVILSVFESLFE